MTCANLVDRSTGEIVGFITGSPESVQASVDALPADATVWISDTPLDGAAVYIHEGSVVEYPPRPSPAHRWSWTARAWTDERSPEQVAADLWAPVRRKRDALLAATDWVVLRAVEQGASVPTEWLAYRQALRDMTDTSILEVSWPLAPGQVSHKS
jgi:hypothetical protein